MSSLTNIYSTDELEKEALKRYPLNHTVDDLLGETGVAETDPYGYDETARKAFIEGGKFIQAHYARQEAEIELKALTDLDNAYDEVTPENFHEYYTAKVAQLTPQAEQERKER